MQKTTAMKRFLLFLISFLLFTGIEAQVSEKAFKTWHGNKYSMFIHFGIYSELGAEWEGKPVTRGYSAQIQAFAGIFSDWYGDIALRFNPTKFNADEIVALAKRAGMRSIVMTTKHHDGFCMFHTATTDYNSFDATPGKRDFIKELSEACKRGGIRFGLYFSVIDWHYPHAYPISSHNCDFITPQHHEFSKAQITELLTKYGPISELWFDMGSNTPAQSKELYDLVHKLQPDCMVSGRVGNDQYDFGVLADNKYPETALQCPWQSAASLFDETWSYRAWLKRGDSHVKAMEKLRSLINVVSYGGNYLLNIGPKGDGSVVPFEAEVLEEIGDWLKKNGDAIYETEASPFREQFDWGMITRKANRLNLILSGSRPTDGHIQLNMPNYKLVKSDGKLSKCTQKDGVIDISLPTSAYSDKTIHVVTLDFDRTVEPLPFETIKGNMLTSHNATPNYSYSCFDYYSNFRSTVSYSWNVGQSNLNQVELIYTDQEMGKTVDLTLDNKTFTVELANGKPSNLSVAPGTIWGKRYLCGPGSGQFDAPSTIQTDLKNLPIRNGAWKEVEENHMKFRANILESYFLMQDIESPCAQEILAEVGSGNGLDLFVNGKSIMKHLNPYRCKFRSEKVIIPLQKGKNQIVLRLYNRFEKETGYTLRPATEQTVYHQSLNLPESVKGKIHTITVRQHGLPSQHSDTELSNLKVKLEE